MQRVRLQSQYECASLRLLWSIVTLDPVKNLTDPRLWVPDTYSSFYETAIRALDVAKTSVLVNRHARFLFHSDAIRPTILLLQIILRKVTMERTQLDKYIARFRDGIKICRSLVPKEIAKVEDSFERLLKE